MCGFLPRIKRPDWWCKYLVWQMLGSAFTAQHSDARVLEQLVYKVIVDVRLIILTCIHVSCACTYMYTCFVACPFHVLSMYVLFCANRCYRKQICMYVWMTIFACESNTRIFFRHMIWESNQVSMRIHISTINEVVHFSDVNTQGCCVARVLMRSQPPQSDDSTMMMFVCV